MATTVLTEITPEKATRRLTLTILDLAGTGFLPDVLTVTLYNNETGAVINSRDVQNIRNTNNGTVDSAGVVVLTLQPLDNVIATPRTGKTQETHRALFQWKRNSDGLESNHTIEFTIEDQSKVS